MPNMNKNVYPFYDKFTMLTIQYSNNFHSETSNYKIKHLRQKP